MPGPRRLRCPGRTRRDPPPPKRRHAQTLWSSRRSRPRLPLFDAASREYAYHRNQEMLRNTGGISPTSMNPTDPAEARVVPPWRRHVDQRRRRADRAGRADFHPARARAAPRPRDHHRPGRGGPSRGVCAGPRGGRRGRDAATSSRRPAAITITARPPGRPRARCSSRSRRSTRSRPSSRAASAAGSCSGRSTATSWRRSAASLITAVQMPGWTNVWTMPIQNRVDMLATGVNTPIGIRVLGRNLDDVVRGSEEVARVVKPLRGAVDVVADPIRGKPYIEIRLDRARAARLGVQRRRRQRADRDRPGRQGRHVDRRGPRAPPRRRPLRPRLARRRRVDPEPPR